MKSELFEKIFAHVNSTDDLVDIKRALDTLLKEVAAKVLEPYTDKIIWQLDVLADIWDLRGDICSSSGPDGVSLNGLDPYKGKPFCYRELDRYLGRKVEHPATGVGIFSKINDEYCIAHSMECANPACKKLVKIYQVPGGGSKTCFRYAYYDKAFKERISLAEYHICCKKCRTKKN